jgi:hypothetical protein
MIKGHKAKGGSFFILFLLRPPHLLSFSLGCFQSHYKEDCDAVLPEVMSFLIYWT